MNQKKMFFCAVLAVTCLLAGCGNKSDKTAAGTLSDNPSVPASKKAAPKDSEAAKSDGMKDAVLGAKLSYFDSKFGAGVMKDGETTYGYLEGKLRVKEISGFAYTIFISDKQRKEPMSPDEALSFMKQFLPRDAKLVKDTEDKETTIHTYTYTSQALKAQTGLSGQFIIFITKDPDDNTKAGQAQMGIDVTGDLP